MPETVMRPAAERELTRPTTASGIEERMRQPCHLTSVPVAGGISLNVFSRQLLGDRKILLGGDLELL